MLNITDTRVKHWRTFHRHPTAIPATPANNHFSID